MVVCILLNAHAVLAVNIIHCLVLRIAFGVRRIICFVVCACVAQSEMSFDFNTLVLNCTENLGHCFFANDNFFFYFSLP